MNPLLLSRIQFSVTSIYHFFLVPLTLGLTILVAVFETFYVATGKEIYKRQTQFWGKLLLINYAAGVVTGIVQEFHFGMNWSGYARFMGDIFGAPLAIEALLAFFLESTFLGLWVFGWEKLGKKTHLATIWLVALGANISGYWILIANSFMQNPVGYALENGRALMVDFGALVSNPNLPYQFLHVFAAGLMTAGFVVLGFSAWHLLKDKESEGGMFGMAFRWAALYALIGSALVFFVGDAHGKYLALNQPMKISAAEAIWEDVQPADFIVVAAIDEKAQTNPFEIKIPYALSLLIHGNLTGGIEGLRTLQAQAEKQYGPGNYIPPVAMSFWSFRLMVGFGALMGLLALLALLRPYVKYLGKSRLLLQSLIPAILLPYLAATFGWILTETARQPWIVYGQQKVADAVSPNLTTGMVLISLLLFILLEGAVVGVTAWLIIKFGTAKQQIEVVEEK